jgi:hypothetical protein
MWIRTSVTIVSWRLFLSSLLLLLLHDGFLRPDTRSRSRWLYALVSVAALYTQYYLGFLLVANAAGLLAARRWRPLAQYLGIMLGVGLAFAPMAAVVLSQVSEHTGTLINDATPVNALLSISYIAQEMVVPIYGFRSLRWLALVAPILAAAGLILIWCRSRVGPRELALWATLAVAASMYAAAILISGIDLVTIRHCVGLFVVLNLVSLSVIALLDPARRRWALSVWILLVLCISGFELDRMNRPLANSGDWRRVAAFIQEREQEGQPILVFPADEALPFELHYSGINSIIPVPRPADFKGLHGSVLHSEEDVASAVATVPGEHEELWVISTMRPGSDSFISVEYNSRYLLEYLGKRYRRTTGKDFLGSELMLVRKK